MSRFRDDQTNGGRALSDNPSDEDQAGSTTPTRLIDQPWVTTAAIVAAVVVVLAVAALIAVGVARKSKTAAPKAPKATTTTTAKATGTSVKPAKITWTHTDLQGNVIVVSRGPSGSAAFIKAKNGTLLPAAVVAIDDAGTATDPCAAIDHLYQGWTKSSGTTQASKNRASAYAAYALEKGKAHNCSWAAAG